MGWGWGIAAAWISLGRITAAVHRLIRGVLRRRGSLARAAAEDVAEKAAAAGALGLLMGLLYLLQLVLETGVLLLEILELRLGLRQAVLLHEHGLGEHIRAVGVAGKPLLQALFGGCVLVLNVGAANAADQAVDHLLLLRGHGLLLSFVVYDAGSAAVPSLGRAFGRKGDCWYS